MSSVVANAFEILRSSVRFGDEQRISSKMEVLSNLERETTDLSRYVDVVTMAMLENGAAPRIETIVTEVETISVADVVRTVDGLLSRENVRWEYVAMP
jgi:hypothetical protein